MTQHILMIWLATAVGAFSGLVGCTTKAKDEVRQETTTAQRDLDRSSSAAPARIVMSGTSARKGTRSQGEHLPSA
jgi:hypothetical protein